ncbi:hypothetical protein HanIR_Chr13g0665911 [Helianthus annuus]|nr:hypothetical protein HanIR_Chr13g0665911 [Helianthus annuus]
MNINELPTERFTNCSLNIRFVYSQWRTYSTNRGSTGYPQPRLRSVKIPLNSISVV